MFWVWVDGWVRASMRVDREPTPPPSPSPHLSIHNLTHPPSRYWYESPGARNVTLSENVYVNCNEDISQNKGMLTFLPDPIQLTPVTDDIRIELSAFIFGNNSQQIVP
jgi:hypothetical protein